jgi:signal transduction histidine kinase
MEPDMTTTKSARKADRTTASEAYRDGWPVRVLLVEDDEDDYLLTRDLLWEIGKERFALDWAETFEDAVALIARQQYDVYLVDYHLGAYNGLQLLSEAERKGTPIILLTGVEDWDIDVRAAKAGAADYLVKGQIDACLLERSIRYAIERKRAENALKEADRRKDEFLAMLAHELRNPLVPVRNGLHILSMPGASTAMIRQAKEMMEHQVEHLVRLVDDLLDVSRVVRGNIELRREKVDLSTVVHRALETAQPAIDIQGHELTVSLPARPVMLEADTIRLAQIISNLLVNAAKYTERAGRIWLTAERDDDHEAVSIRVKDSGIGIDAGLLPHVFDMFMQADRSLDRSQGGLGIGLTLVKRLVEMHGGSVTATSPGLGQGSEFIVRLPALPACEAPNRASVSQVTREQPAGSARRVLVVDDNGGAAESTAMLLRIWGHEVRTVHDGRSALQAVLDFHPEIVLLDIGLPGMNGYEVAKQLRAQKAFKSLVLAAMTGYGQDDDRRRSKEAGFDFHLTKPLEPEVLEAFIATRQAASIR